MIFSQTDILLEPDRDTRTDRIAELLSDEVGKVLFDGNGYLDVEGLVRVVVPLEPTRPLRWLSRQHAGKRFYWSGRGEDAEEVACLGIADEIRGTSPDDLEKLYHRSTTLLGPGAEGARYYGGCAFDFSADVSGEWSSFPPVWFFLPRFELHTSRNVSRLVCNLVLPRDRARASEILEAIEQLDTAPAPLAGSLPLPVARRNVPERPEWLRAIEQTLALLSDDALGKVVMARKARFEFADRLDAFALLDRIAAVTPACFHFLVEIEPGVAFVGASPERLFRRTGRTIESEAVAGTRPRGRSMQDDERLRDELLLSKKDRLEHAFVEDSIRRVLSDLCIRVDVDARASAMTLASGRHICSGIQAELRDAVRDVDVLRALHPTPAVGGHPTDQALEVIRELEPFDRGWYAGPVGWMSPDASEFAVAIRTGLVRPDSLTLFSGAGIVSGSQPQSEWDEIEQKIGDFTNVLGLDLDRAKY